MNCLRYNKESGLFVGVLASLFLAAMVFILTPYAVCSFNYHKIKQLEARVEKGESELVSIKEELKKISETNPPCWAQDELTLGKYGEIVEPWQNR